MKQLSIFAFEALPHDGVLSSKWHKEPAWPLSSATGTGSFAERGARVHQADELGHGCMGSTAVRWAQQAVIRDAVANGPYRPGARISRSSFALFVRLEASAGGADGRQASARRLCLNRLQKVAPQLVEQLGALGLEFCRQRVRIDAGLDDRRQRLARAPSVAGQEAFDYAVIGEMQQRFLGNRLDGVRRGQSADVEHIPGAGVFHASSLAKRESLWARAPVFKALPALQSRRSR